MDSDRKTLFDIEFENSKKIKKIACTLADYVGRAVAPGLQPLRLPRAPRGVQGWFFKPGSMLCIPVGTVEGISTRILAANSRGDKAKEGRKSRHYTNSLGERVESWMTLVVIHCPCRRQYQ